MPIKLSHFVGPYRYWSNFFFNRQTKLNYHKVIISQFIGHIMSNSFLIEDKNNILLCWYRITIFLGCNIYIYILNLHPKFTLSYQLNCPLGYIYRLFILLRVTTLHFIICNLLLSLTTTISFYALKYNWNKYVLYL